MAMEYVFLAIESRMAEVKERDIWKNIKSYMTIKHEGRLHKIFSWCFDASMVEHF